MVVEKAEFIEQLTIIENGLPFLYDFIEEDDDDFREKLDTLSDAVSDLIDMLRPRR